MRSDFPDGTQDLIEQQGWDAETLVFLLTAFLVSQNDLTILEKLEAFLQEAADSENNTEEEV